jgi:hypothetical protein
MKNGKNNIFDKILITPTMDQDHIIGLGDSCSILEKIAFDDAVMAMNRAIDKCIKIKYGGNI